MAKIRRRPLTVLLEAGMALGLGSCSSPSAPPEYRCYVYTIDIHPGDGGAASIEETGRALLAAGSAGCWEQDEGTRLRCALPDDVDSQSLSACEAFVATALDDEDGGVSGAASTECENTCNS